MSGGWVKWKPRMSLNTVQGEELMDSIQFSETSGNEGQQQDLFNKMIPSYFLYPRNLF